MGIRCQCPNGHVLNLKSFLAGRRGICPQCQAKFIIPRESLAEDAGAAPVADPTLESVSIQTASDLKPVTATAGVTVGSMADDSAASAQRAAQKAAQLNTAVKSTPAVQVPAAASKQAVADETAAETAWYVRLESGEQFGPANAKTLQAWADEGRVPPSALLWHEDWEDWHLAETVLAGGPIVVPDDPGQPTPGQLAPGQLATDQASSNPASSKRSASSWAEGDFPLQNDEPHVQAEGRHDTVTLKHRRRRGEGRKIAATTILLLLLAVMVPVLVLVVFR